MTNKPVHAIAAFLEKEGVRGPTTAAVELLRVLGDAGYVVERTWQMLDSLPPDTENFELKGTQFAMFPSGMVPNGWRSIA